MKGQREMLLLSMIEENKKISQILWKMTLQNAVASDDSHALYYNTKDACFEA